MTRDSVKQAIAESGNQEEKSQNVLGVAVVRILLAIVFYVLVTPIGLSMRLFGKDPIVSNRLQGSHGSRVASKVRDRGHFKKTY